MSSSETIDFNKTYSKTAVDFKPKGLWYAINDEWLEWCFSEMPHWIKGCVFELDMDLSKILIIKTGKELDVFITAYETDPYNFCSGINWSQVKKDYKGIEIVNYHKLKWSLTNPMFQTWFYGWDVSGGCIWDLSVLKSVTKYPIPNKYIKIEVET
jgi:hypothetical protein